MKWHTFSCAMCPRGALTWKGGTGMCGPQEPFQVSPVIHKTPSWGTSPFTRPLLKEKCDISPPKSNIFRKFVNFQLEKLKFACNFHQKAWKFHKILVLKPIFFDEILTGPHFHGNLLAHKSPSLKIQASYTYQKKQNKTSVCPPPWGHVYLHSLFPLGAIRITMCHHWHGGCQPIVYTDPGKMRKGHKGVKSK